MISMVHDMWDKEAGTNINSYRPNLRASTAWLFKDSESSRLPELTLRASTSGELHHPRCVPPPGSDMAKMASECTAPCAQHPAQHPAQHLCLTSPPPSGQHPAQHLCQTSPPQSGQHSARHPAQHPVEQQPQKFATEDRTFEK